MNFFKNIILVLALTTANISFAAVEVTIIDDETANLYNGAEAGNKETQYRLGSAYKNGRNVPQDDEAAVKWYRAAAEQGYAPAQFALGVMYYLGEGVAQNFVKSYMWVYLAEQANYPDVDKYRAKLETRMTKIEIKEAIDKATSCIINGYKGC